LHPSRVGNVIPLESGRQIVDQRASCYSIDYELLDDVVDKAVRCFDNVPERTVFPLEEQRQEALTKRRMGLGVTGVANAIEIMGYRYGSPGYLAAQDEILDRISLQAYRTSIELAREKEPFPLFDAEKYFCGWYVQDVLNDEIRHGIQKHGLRNGVLLSIAPTGTISLAADNILSGIEPPYAMHTEIDVQFADGKKTTVITDYTKEFYGVTGQTATETTAEQHIDALCPAQKFVDSSISKTVNVNGQIAGQGPGVSFADFKRLYTRAYTGGAKGCATHNATGKLMGVRRDADQPIADQGEGAACTIDEYGRKSCAAD
jgi:ribonucleoside-diphosphate reductase alpha chain